MKRKCLLIIKEMIGTIPAKTRVLIECASTEMSAIICGTPGCKLMQLFLLILLPR